MNQDNNNPPSSKSTLLVIYAFIAFAIAMLIEAFVRH
jgi:hypothetical protein